MGKALDCVAGMQRDFASGNEVRAMSYFWTTKEARAGNLEVIRSTRRTYGFSLRHKPTGETACWYRLKRDALSRIDELANCPNTPREA